MEKNQWLHDRITIISALSKKTETQELLLELHKIESRTPEQQRDYDILVRAEKAAAKAEKAAKEASTLASKKREAERKARAHEMIQLAGLLALVRMPSGEPLLDSATGKLQGMSKATLLGILDVAVKTEDKNRFPQWNMRGEKILAELEKPKSREEKPETTPPEPQKQPTGALQDVVRENPQPTTPMAARPFSVQNNGG